VQAIARLLIVERCLNSSELNRKMMDEAWIKKHRPNVKVMGMTEERHEAPLTAAEI